MRELIKIEGKRQGLTTKELAKIAGMSEQSFKRWLYGAPNIRTDALEKLFKHLGLKVVSFYAFS
jgi:transcriptional regulator with XRE-family HTH domain